jgi:peptidoglycan L-alanyl-D-glutamate endopeptidase CwlK
MASRNPQDLHPELRPLFSEWAARCEAAGLDVLVTCTYRSNAEQDALYEQGRTKPGAIVTKARGGQSEHNFMLNGRPASKAWDFVPLENGKAMWSDKHPVWKIAGQIAMDLGLNWYGRPGAPFKEFPHVALKKS